MSDRKLDFYKILQVHPEAEPETIKQVYRLLARKYHPDAASSSLKSSYEEKMKLINSAYAVLCEPDAREEYDKSSKSSADIQSYQVQFEIATVLGETASAGGGKLLCYESSASIIKGIIESNSDQAVVYEAFVRLAQIQYLGTENYADATKSFLKLLGMSNKPEDRDELFFCIIDCHVKRAAYKNAVLVINELLTECEDPETIITSEVTRANLLKDIPDYNQALEAYQFVVEKYPGSKEAAYSCFQRARILDSNLSRWHDAIAEYRTVMSDYSQYQWATDCKWRIDLIQRKHIDKKGWWAS